MSRFTLAATSFSDLFYLLSFNVLNGLTPNYLTMLATFMTPNVTEIIQLDASSAAEFKHEEDQVFAVAASKILKFSDRI